MHHIFKSFSGVQVLKDVSFQVEKGEIHALMGENGAGKSTLIKILTGIYSKDEGKIKVKGEETTFHNPKQAEKAGIAVIHQELNILPELTVTENLFLGKEQKVKGTPWIKTKTMEQEAADQLKELGLNISPQTRAGRLSVGQQQLIEIAKAIMTDAEIIIMDEPTAALTNREIDTLFQVIKRMKQKDVSIVYISHRMEEIFSICDRITILRDGMGVGTKHTHKTHFEEIVTMMVGRDLGERFPSVQKEIKEEKLKVQGLTRAREFEDITFTVCSGEILGVAGLMGSGRTEIMETLFGYRKRESGKVFIDGKEANISHPKKAMELGIGFITEDRKHQGLVTHFSIQDNLNMPNLKTVSNNGWMNAQHEKNLYEEMTDKLTIRSSGPHQLTRFLSGGNQQKVVIGKWLGLRPKILILDEPTRGVDVGAKKEIYKIINELAQEGVAIIMVSSELPEVIGLSDRIMVMHEGEIGVILQEKEISQETIMHYATGGAKRVGNAE